MNQARRKQIHSRLQRPLIALVSSRLGHNIHRHRRVAAFLFRSACDAKKRGGSWLVASGSAIDPWARRAAELYHVPITWLTGNWDNGSGPAGDICFVDPKIDRDHAVVELADRIDAVHVRKGGKIDHALHSRLQTDRSATIRVAIETDAKSAVPRLLTAGAVGWYLPVNKPVVDISIDTDQIEMSDPQSSLGNDDWLVHCTRGVHGPWPDETRRQYLDSILLGSTKDISLNDRDSVDTLVRIVRSQKLVGSAITSSHQSNVVCFSARRLIDLIRGRTYRSHLKRWDYEPYGILIRKSAAIDMGARPVIYGNAELKKRLPLKERYRYHPPGKTHDWRWEREWRFSGSIALSQIPSEDVRVFCLDSSAHRDKLKPSPWPIVWLSSDNAAGSLTSDSKQTNDAK